MPDWRNPFEDFYHDEEMFGPGTQPLQVVEDIPNFYIGPPDSVPRLTPSLTNKPTIRGLPGAIHKQGNSRGRKRQDGGHE